MGREKASDHHDTPRRGIALRVRLFHEIGATRRREAALEEVGRMVAVLLLSLKE